MDHRPHLDAPAVLAHVRPVALVVPAGPRLGDQRVETLHLGGRVDRLRAAPADHLALVVPQHPLRPGVEQPDPAVEVGGEDGELGGRRQHGLQLAGDLGEALLGLPAGGHVEEDAAGVQELAAARTQIKTLERELEQLRRERDVVKNKVESLLEALSELTEEHVV